MPRAIKSINQAVGCRLKQHRIAARLTREQLAELSGYSANFIQEVERGRSGLSSESIRAFASALHISADNLLFGNESSDYGFILERLKTVPPEKLESVIRVIDAVIDCARS